MYMHFYVLNRLVKNIFISTPESSTGIYAEMYSKKPHFGCKNSDERFGEHFLFFNGAIRFSFRFDAQNLKLLMPVFARKNMQSTC